METVVKSKEKLNGPVPSFSYLWETDDLADGMLILRNPDGNGPAKKRKQTYSRKMELGRHKIHRALWGAHSEYFRAIFLRWSSQDKITFLDVQPDEVEAINSVVKFFYFGAFEQIIAQNPAALMDIMRMANRIQAISCLHNASALFASLPKEKISNSLISSFFGTFQHPVSGMEAARKICEDCLLERFGRLDDLFQNNNKDVLLLSQPAMVALLSTEEICCTSENTVLALAMWWVEDGEGQKCSKEQLEELAHCIRIGLLSPAFFLQILPEAKWIEVSPSQHKALAHFVLTRESKDGWDSSFRQAVADSTVPPIPSIWWHKERENIKEEELMCTASISRSSFDQFLLNSDSECLLIADTEHVFWRGYVWSPEICISKDFKEDLLGMSCEVIVGDRSYPIYQTYSVKVGIKDRRCSGDEDIDLLHTSEPMSNLLHMSDILFPLGDPSFDKEKWEPFFIGENITFQITVCSCL